MARAKMRIRPESRLIGSSARCSRPRSGYAPAPGLRWRSPCRISSGLLVDDFRPSAARGAHGNADAVAAGNLHPPSDCADTESEVKKWSDWPVVETTGSICKKYNMGAWLDRRTDGAVRAFTEDRQAFPARPCASVNSRRGYAWPTPAGRRRGRPRWRRTARRRAPLRPAPAALRRAAAVTARSSVARRSASSSGAKTNFACGAIASQQPMLDGKITGVPHITDSTPTSPNGSYFDASIVKSAAR